MQGSIVTLMFSSRGRKVVHLFLLLTLGGFAPASHARPVDYDEAKVTPLHPA